MTPIRKAREVDQLPLVESLGAHISDDDARENQVVLFRQVL